MFLKCRNGSFGSVDMMVVWGKELNANLLRPDICLDCGITLIIHHVQASMYLSDFRVVITSVNAVIMDASVREGMTRTIIVLRS